MWHRDDLRARVSACSFAKTASPGWQCSSTTAWTSIQSKPTGSPASAHRATCRLGDGASCALRPSRRAELADRLLKDYSLDFYIANPEAEYKYSSDEGTSGERYGRSQRFVDSFRSGQMPAAISSYCRADTQNIDWEAWNRSSFAFLPQAYVNDFGEATSPAACAKGAADFFPAHAVHPTVGVYAGQQGKPGPARYAELLDKAGTVGFSVYLAETRMRVEHWRMFGEAVVELAIARRPGDETPIGDRSPTRTSRQPLLTATQRDRRSHREWAWSPWTNIFDSQALRG